MASWQLVHSGTAAATAVWAATFINGADVILKPPDAKLPGAWQAAQSTVPVLRLSGGTWVAPGATSAVTPYQLMPEVWQVMQGRATAVCPAADRAGVTRVAKPRPVDVAVSLTAWQPLLPQSIPLTGMCLVAAGKRAVPGIW